MSNINWKLATKQDDEIIGKIVSQIIQDDRELYFINESETDNIIKAFEHQLGFRLRIYAIHKVQQLSMF